jgi:hypothetical protein
MLGRMARNRKSLDQVVREKLPASTLERPQKADFRDLVGQWTPDPQFDEIVKSQRRIDRKKWH